MPTFDDRFPRNAHSSWQAVGHGYKPNHAVVAQPCEQCGALVDYGFRKLHSRRHDGILRRLWRWIGGASW